MKSGIDIAQGVVTQGEDFRQTKKLTVSIIIPHYELHDMIKNFCLLNLYLWCDSPVVIVDNGSKKPLEVEWERLKVIRSKARLSFAKACNLGVDEVIFKTHTKKFSLSYNTARDLREQAPDIFIFLNNDIQVLPGFLEPIVKAFDDPKVVICGAKLLGTDGRIQHIGISFGKKRLPYHHRMGEEDNPKENKTVDVLAVTGALMAVRTSWFDKVGGFSEDFPGGNYEDVDLCLRAKKEGCKVKVALSSKAIHLGGASYQLHPEEHT